MTDEHGEGEELESDESLDDEQRDDEQGSDTSEDANAESASSESPGKGEPSQKIEVERERDSDEDDHVEGGEITFRYYGAMDVGLIRDHNEDNFVTTNLDNGVRDIPDDEVQEGTLGPRGLLLSVCDGMGGAAAGEVASQMAVDTLHDIFTGSEPTADRDDFAHRVVYAVEEAGARIFGAAKMDRSRRGMGTTATAAGLMDKVLFVGQVGDSRAYLLRDGECGLITKDQSLVNQLIEAGQLTEEEAEAFEHSNIILQALGTTEDVTVDLTFVELRRGDRLMLCSDGLSGMVHFDMIKEILSDVGDIKEATHQLIEMANAGGGHDNITCVICDFAGEGLASPLNSLTPSYHQYPLPEATSETFKGLSDPPRKARGYRDSGKKMGARKPGADVKHAFDDEESGFPWWLVAVVLIAFAAAGAIAMTISKKPPEPIATTLAPEPTEDQPVEVSITTDIDGELFVDGESYGEIAQGQDIVVELAPGVYRLAAHALGNEVVAESITVVAGTPADVELMMPLGHLRVPDAVLDANVLDATVADAPDASVDGAVDATEAEAALEEARLAEEAEAAAAAEAAAEAAAAEEAAAEAAAEEAREAAERAEAEARAAASARSEMRETQDAEREAARQRRQERRAREREAQRLVEEREARERRRREAAARAAMTSTMTTSTTMTSTTMTTSMTGLGTPTPMQPSSGLDRPPPNPF